ncbi:MAG: polysaccharide pyruvyl transferase family protein [Dysgonamonadaceae bacterium]|jgi:polysaccharide pyruvyl transferase WcaK-like protein|nr:polysaccharide pyruvyl transferase family protein [Dysgonamonadaceae bacterium]
MKIALLWTNPYCDNRGVGALTYSLLYILHEISKENNLSFEYFIIGTASKPFNKDTVKIMDLEVPVTNVRRFGSTGCKELIKKIVFNKQYRLYSQFDYVLDIGLGDSYTDIYGIDRFKMINTTRQLFINKNIKQLLSPQTIGPFNNLRIKQEAIKTINKCAVVLARDKQSYDFLTENTAQKNIGEIIDMAFYMPYCKKGFSKGFVHVGLNISALLWHGGYTKDNQFGLVVDYKILIRNIIDYFLSVPNVKIHLVPHVVSSGYHDENDYAVSYHLVESYNDERIVLSPLFLTPVLAKNYIAGLDFFAGARMHATIAAFSSGVPVYPMAYSRKFNGLFMDTLDYPYMGDMKVQTNDEILSGIKDAFEKKDELKAIIQNRMNGIVAERKKLLKKHLVDFLKLK